MSRRTALGQAGARRPRGPAPTTETRSSHASCCGKPRPAQGCGSCRGRGTGPARISLPMGSSWPAPARTWAWISEPGPRKAAPIKLSSWTWPAGPSALPARVPRARGDWTGSRMARPCACWMSAACGSLTHSMAGCARASRRRPFHPRPLPCTRMASASRPAAIATPSRSGKRSTVASSPTCRCPRAMPRTSPLHRTGRSSWWLPGPMACTCGGGRSPACNTCGVAPPGIPGTGVRPSWSSSLTST